MDMPVEFFKWIDEAMAKHGPWFVIAVWFFIASLMVGRWAGPRFDNVITALTEFLQKIDERTMKHEHRSAVQSKGMKRLHSVQASHKEISEKTFDLVQDIHTKVIKEKQ